MKYRLAFALGFFAVLPATAQDAPLDPKTTPTSEFVTRCSGSAGAPGCAFNLEFAYALERSDKKNACPPGEEQLAPEDRDKQILDWLSKQKALAGDTFGESVPKAMAALWPCNP